MTPPSRFLLIDSVRGIASLWILCLHVLPAYLADHSLIMTFVNLGRVGTDFFFVTSGFVSAIACNKIVTSPPAGSTPLQFSAKRLKKIYLIYFFSFLMATVFVPIVMALATALKHGYLEFEFAQLSVSETFLYLSLAKVFTAESWVLSKAFVEINGVYWFIAVLIQIYIFIEIALRFRRHFRAILISTFFLSLLSFLPQVQEILPKGVFLFKFAEFFLGMLLWHVIYKSAPDTLKRLHKFVPEVVVAAFAAQFWLYHYPISEDLYRFNSAVLVGLLLFALYPKDQVISNTAVLSAFRKVGKFSYSIYLNHVIFWPLAYMIVSNLVPWPMNIAAPALLIPLIVFMSFIFYTFFERSNTLICPLKYLSKPLNSLKEAKLSLNS